MTTSLFEVHFGTAEQFLAELAADIEDEAVLGNIVRLALVSGQAPGKFGMDRAKAWYLEASYVSTRQQLVKLSIGCGWYGLPGTHFVNAEHLEERVKDRLREASHKVEEGIRQHPSIRLRGGSLREGEGPWSIGEADIEDAPAESCAGCHEPIYFANEQWRHEATKQAEHYSTAKCGRCREGFVTRPRQGLCPDCHGSTTIKNLDHLADPTIEGRKV